MTIDMVLPSSLGPGVRRAGAGHGRLVRDDSGGLRFADNDPEQATSHGPGKLPGGDMDPRNRKRPKAGIAEFID
jgi:hypothetical protein